MCRISEDDGILRFVPSSIIVAVAAWMASSGAAGEFAVMSTIDAAVLRLPASVEI